MRVAVLIAVLRRKVAEILTERGLAGEPFAGPI
jgi:hypothetical protein